MIANLLLSGYILIDFCILNLINSVIRESFGDNNVGLLTGDSAVNREAQILIMTTEILRNM